MSVKVKTIIVLTLAVLFTSASNCLAQAACTEPGSIRSVTKLRSGGIETVTFEVNGESPHYEVKTGRPPFQEYGSGDVLKIKGPYYKSVYFKGINWMCTIAERLTAPSANIGGVNNIEQFEGHVNYIIGYRRRGSYLGTTETTSNGRTTIVVKFRS